MRDNFGEFLYSKYVTVLINNADRLDGPKIYSIIISDNYSVITGDVLANLAGLPVTRNVNVPKDSLGLNIYNRIEINYLEKAIKMSTILLFDADANFVKMKRFNVIN